MAPPRGARWALRECLGRGELARGAAAAWRHALNLTGDWCALATTGPRDDNHIDDTSRVCRGRRDQKKRWARGARPRSTARSCNRAANGCPQVFSAMDCSPSPTATRWRCCSPTGQAAASNRPRRSTACWCRARAPCLGASRYGASQRTSRPNPPARAAGGWPTPRRRCCGKGGFEAGGGRDP